VEKTEKTYEQLLARIKELEDENLTFKTVVTSSNGETVSVPSAFKPIFDKAQATVKDYFKNLKLFPEKGTIEINDQRYVLVRASALSYEFFNNIKNMYLNKGEEEAFAIGRNFLFDIGHVLGMEDAKRFHEKMNLQNPIEKLSAGPVHFAYSGWAFVDISPESTPSPDENFFLKYNHPYSFEADSWIKSGELSKFPVCTMNAAYSSGWCQESFGIPLTAVEITCKARGDENCTFIMAQPNRINEFLDKEVSKNNIKVKPEVPFFFERKKIEEELIKNQQLLNTAQKMAKLGSWEFTIADENLIWSDELYSIYQIDKNHANSNELYKVYLSRLTEVDQQVLFQAISSAINEGKEYTIKHIITLPDGSVKWILGTGVPIKDADGKVIRLMGIGQDITDSILQQDKLQLNLKEKETLLKEIHHRVKNNLQIISSLLNLQSSVIDDEKVKGLYNESQNRIRSMATIHEMLYQSNDIAKINIRKYIESLFEQLCQVMLPKDKEIGSLFNVPDFYFSIDTAIPLGLLINELFTNSFKYGLAVNTKTIIEVDLKKVDGNEYSLLIGDNGVGFKENLPEYENKSLGIMLIHSLASQLDGEAIKIESDKPGAIYQIKFSGI
jgi:two-component sensor histidine kinase/predicted hydrocarbon binding protein